jgi:hypothetical protein
MSDCHTKAADLHDDLRGQLEAMLAHIDQANEHVKAMFESAGGGRKPSEGDEDGDEGTGDDDPELAAEAEQRKRMFGMLSVVPEALLNHAAA